MNDEINLRELLYKNIIYKDLLGEHGGVIDEIRIKENGIFVYGLFFGQNVWLKLDELNKTWWLNS